MADTTNYGGTLEILREGQAIVRIENEAIQQVAIARPRPPVEKLLASAVAELEAVPEFASAAYYSIPYKQYKGDESGQITYVEGPSIKAANILQRHFRNSSSGSRIVGEDDGYIYEEGVAIDLESNVRILTSYKTRKVAWDKATRTYKPMLPDRLNLAIQADLSKARRNAVLNLIPVSMVMPFLTRAKELAASLKTSAKEKPKPLVERAAAVIQRLVQLGATQEAVLSHIGRPAVTEVTEQDVQTLIGIGTAIRDGMTTVEDAFSLRSDTVEKPSAEQVKAKIAIEEMLGISLDAPPPADTTTAPPATEVIRQAMNDIIAQLFDRWPQRQLNTAEDNVLGKLLMRAYAVSTIADVERLGWERMQAGLEKLEEDVREVLRRRKGKKL